MSTNLAVITDDIYNTRDAFTAVLSDKSINFEREAGFAVQVLQASEYALKAAMGNRQSVINAVTNIAAIGISLNPAKKQAYLVPRDGRICLDISYMGLIDLAVSTGSIKWAQADLVHANDAFELNGYDKPPAHSYQPFGKDRGEVVGAYVVAKTADGDYLTETMARADIDAIMNRSQSVKSGKSSPWKTDYGEMAKKTVVKRASKYWPKVERLDKAIHHLNTEGGEGINFEAERTGMDPGLMDELRAAVAGANTADELAAVWKANLTRVKAAATAAKSTAVYDQFKLMVSARGGQLRGEAVPTQTPADDGKTIDEQPADTGSAWEEGDASR